MCSTCNYKNFEPYEVTANDKPVLIDGKPVVRLRNTNVSINIHCDMKGKNYKIDNFTIYWCPTCGHKLY